MSGRPSTYSDEVAAVICGRLAEGNSLRAICKADDMPAASTVFVWLSQNKTFAEQYARAREAQADALFEEVLEIADGVPAVNDHVSKARLRVDARKWMAGKLAPKKYGDKIALEHGFDESTARALEAARLRARRAAEKA